MQSDVIMWRIRAAIVVVGKQWGLHNLTVNTKCVFIPHKFGLKYFSF